MNAYIENAIIEAYDEYVRKAGVESGVKVADARAAIRSEIRDLVATTDRDVEQETDTLIADTIRSSRDRRRESLKKNLETLLDGFNEDGAYVDPILDQAFGLGDKHGMDKTLRHWTVDDFRHLVVTRYRVAAEATEAAADTDQIAERVIGRMRVEGAAVVGDVDWGAPAQGW